MTTAAAKPDLEWAPRTWFVIVRNWLQRFPMSVILLAMRIGVGSVFFKAGLLKYQSFEFAVKLFEDEYKVPNPQPDRRCKHYNVQRAHMARLPVPGARDSFRHTADSRLDHRDSAVCLPKRVDGKPGVGVNSRDAAHTRRGGALARLSH